MSTRTKLGFIQLPTSEVISLTEAALAAIQAKRDAGKEEFITNMMKPRKGWFFTRAAQSREAAEAEIKENEFHNEQMWFITKYVGPKQEALEKLRKVGLAILVGGVTTMEVSIEAATWLFPDVKPEVENKC
jgi:2-iminoacetate synthase ThiH